MNNEVDEAYIDYLQSKFGERIYRKKPLEIQAYQIGQPFTVKTLEGVMEGKAGDYVIQGIRGELYICDREIFTATYDFVGIR